jgi:hypothetical protein
MRKAFLVVSLLLLTGTIAAQQIMNNDSVIRLVQAGLSEDLIVVAINSSPGQYDISVDGVLALKTAGASEKVLAAVVTRAGVSGSVAAPSPKNLSEQVFTTDVADSKPLNSDYADQKSYSEQVSIPNVVNVKPLNLDYVNQPEYHRFEIFGGYNYIYLGDNIGSMAGPNVSFTVNINSIFGIKVEPAMLLAESESLQTDFGGSFMVGLQINKRFGKPAPAGIFVHALGGVAFNTHLVPCIH